MIEYYDEEAIFRPELYLSNSKVRLPETAIISWKEGFTEVALKMGAKPVWDFIGGAKQTVYKFESNGKEYAFAAIAQGGPNVAPFMEELKILGTKNFIFVGSCGALNKDIIGKIVVPDKAFRDEGTSWHYIASKDELIDVPTWEKTESLLRSLDIPCIVGSTWTTDAAYRETPSAVKYVMSKGCVCVEMECASIMAVAQAIGVNAYQFLYTSDRLDKTNWERTSKVKRTGFEQYFEIALKLAEL